MWDALAMLACGLSFVWSQRQTWQVQHAADRRGRPNLGALMFLPCLRILPIHLIIIVGGMTGGMTGGAMTLILFTALKTVADIGLDVIDRRMALASSARTAAGTGGF